MESRFLSICGSLISLAAAIAWGAELYVSPAGIDANDGSIGSPLATIAAARDKADQLKTGNTPVTVYLRGGTYYLSAPVVFGPANSGTVTAPIIYSAYKDEKPVVSGGIKVASAWTVSSGQIMVTTIATNLKVDQLFLNGKRQVLARYPNYDSTKKLDGYAPDCISATRVARWANPGEGPGYVRGLHHASWGGNSFIITGKTGTALTMQWVGDNNRGSVLENTFRMVENLFEELDTSGEWYYSKPTGKLYFYPPAGTDLSAARIELASQDELIRVVGTSAAKVKYLSFKGLTFTHTYRTLFSKPYENVFKSDWAISRTGTVFMQNAENVKVEDCLFDQIGGNGIFASGYNRRHVIYNNVFTGAGATCVAIFGLNSSVRCPNSFASTPTCNDRTPGPVDPVNGEFPAYVTVNNNMMYNLGRFEKQSSGICMSATTMDTVRHNTIYKMPRAGINFCDGCWGGHIIEYNWVYQSVLETGDHGPFNAWGRDRTERWQGDTAASKLDAWKTTIVRNNRFEAPDLFFGIDLDDQSSNYLQYNNLLFGGGLKLQWNRYNTYLNNILVSGATVQFHGVWSQSSHYGARNIIVGAAIYGECCFSTTNVPAEVKAAIKQWDSNVVYNSGTTPPFIASWLSTDQKYSWAQWKAAGLDAHSVVADPMFTDVNKQWPNYLPKGDYTVKPGSPALAFGFKNFPMDSFGVMPKPVVAVNSQPSSGMRAIDNIQSAVAYRAGRLCVSADGNHRVDLYTINGRLMRSFKGRGAAMYDLSQKELAPGVYLVRLQSAGGRLSETIRAF